MATEFDSFSSERKILNFRESIETGPFESEHFLCKITPLRFRLFDVVERVLGCSKMRHESY